MNGLPSLQRTEFTQSAPRLGRGAESASAKLWESVANVAGQISDDLVQEAKAARVRYLAGLDNDVEAKATELRNEYHHNPTGFNSAWTQFTAEKLAQTESRMHEDAKLIFDKRFNRVNSILQNEKRERDYNLAAQELGLKTETLDNDLLAMSRAGGTQTEEFTATFAERKALNQTKVGLGMMSKEASDIDLDQLSSRAQAEAILGKVKDVYQQQGPKAAEAMIEAIQSDEELNLSVNNRLSIVRRGRAELQDMVSEQQKVFTKQRADKNAAYDLEISRAGTPIGNKTTSQLYQEIEVDPDISEQERTDFLQRLDEKVIELGKKNEGKLIIQDALGGQATVDYRNKDHREAANNYFEEDLLPTLAGKPLQEQTQEFLNFTKKTGIIPNVVQGQIRSVLRTGEPSQQAVAADYLAAISEVSRESINEFAETDISLAHDINSIVKAGGDPERAVELAQKARNVPESTVALRSSRWKKDKHDEANMKFLRKKSNGPAFANTKIPDHMEAEFNEIHKRLYETNGDEKSSREAAWTILQGSWGETQMLGGRRWMKYAPENYGAPGLSRSRNSEWMQKQLLQEISPAIMIDPNKGELKDRIILEADDVTAREASSGTPSYLVMIQNDDGVFEPIMTTEGIARWSPDYEISDTYLEQREKQDERRARNMEEAVKMHELRRRFEDTEQKFLSQKYGVLK